MKIELKRPRDVTIVNKGSVETDLCEGEVEQLGSDILNWLLTEKGILCDIKIYTGGN